MYYPVKEICVPWGGRGCRDLKVRWWDVSYLAYTHINCKDARDLDILVFVFGFFGGVLVSFYVLGFGFWFGFFRFFRFLSFLGGFALRVS